MKEIEISPNICCFCGEEVKLRGKIKYYKIQNKSKYICGRCYRKNRKKLWHINGLQNYSEYYQENKRKFHREYMREYNKRLKQKEEK